jgi:hypothetical protein
MLSYKDESTKCKSVSTTITVISGGIAITTALFKNLVSSEIRIVHPESSWVIFTDFLIYKITWVIRRLYILSWETSRN